MALTFLTHFGRDMHSASLVVVNVHLLPQIATPFSDIDELAGELEAVADVVGAAAPLPVAQAWHSNGDLWRPRLVTVVTRARLDATLAARPGYRVRHPRTHDGVDESRFSATSINNFSKEIFAPQKIFCGTIPSSVTKLELAFLNGLVSTFGYRY
jgi:hypothetical protein